MLAKDRPKALQRIITVNCIFDHSYSKKPREPKKYSSDFRMTIWSEMYFTEAVNTAEILPTNGTLHLNHADNHIKVINQREHWGYKFTYAQSSSTLRLILSHRV